MRQREATRQLCLLAMRCLALLAGPWRCHRLYNGEADVSCGSDCDSGSAVETDERSHDGLCCQQGVLCQRLTEEHVMSALLLLVRMPELVAVQQEPLRCSHGKQDGDQLLT